MGPTSDVVLVLVLVAAVASFAAVALTKRWFLQVPAAALAFLLSLSTGVLLVNDYYGYYTTWGSAAADLTGGGAQYALAHGVAGGAHDAATHGRLLSVQLDGKRSGIDRKGLVYLPPQYFEARYRDVRFPAVELFHGTPGDPAQWVNEARVTEIAEKLLQSRRMGPMVLVMPDSNGGVSRTEECLNTPAFHDDTYVSQDVPADVRARFRVSADPGQWGLAGLSSGGYCAANLMLRHPSLFGASAALDGYYRPDVENAVQVIGSDRALARANDPLATALRTRPGSRPLDPFWISVGTGDREDDNFAKPMAAAMRRLEAVPFLVVPGARHNMAAIRTMLPSALTWSWQQLCTPDQRREFPTYAAREGQTVVTAPLAHPIPAPVIHYGHPGSSATAHPGTASTAGPAPVRGRA